MRNLIWLATICALLFAGSAFAAGGITGVVVTQQGAPVDQARVSIWANGGCVGHVMTNASGVFAFESVAAGTYLVRAGKPQVGSAALDGVQVYDGQTTDIGQLVLIGGKHGGHPAIR